jgi:hypothetical protein
VSKKKIINNSKDEYWQEIFDSVEMEYLPLEYINRILITFQDGTVWDIDIDDSRKKQSLEQIEDQLDQLFEEYDSKIETIDFRLDLERVKHDLSKRIYRFLKLNK